MGQGVEELARGTPQERVFDRLAALPDGARRIKFLRRLRLISLSTVEQLDEAVRIQVRVDLGKANGLAEAAITIANELGDNESKAYALRAKANALSFLGKNQEASELHAEAARLFDEGGNALEVGRTLSTSIQPLILLGEYNSAHAAASRARAIFSEAGEAGRLARLEINVGNIFHRQDRFREALERYRSAYSQLLPLNDREGIVVALHNSAMCLTMLNDYEASQAAYEEMRAFCQDRDMPLALAQAEYNIAYLFYLRGQYARAIDMLRAAQEMASKSGDGHRAALCLLDLSEIYLELNLTPEAMELAQQAALAFEGLGMKYEAAKAVCQLAIAQSQRKIFRSLMSFAQARAMFVKENNQVWTSLVDLYQALAHFNDGRFKESRVYCCAALVFFRDSPLRSKAVLCRLLLARIALKSGDVPAAREECRLAIAELEGCETPILTYQTQLVMGHVEHAAGHLHEAESHYLVAQDMLETLRRGLYGDELKISFLQNKLELYEGLVDLYLRRGDSPESLEKAWRCMEKAKSRTLLESINARQHAGDGDGRETRSTAEIATLREQLNWYYHRMEVEQLDQPPATDTRLLDLQQQAVKTEKQLRRLIRAMPADVAAAEDPTVTPSSLTAVREALGANTTLLEYFRAQDRVLATIITADGLDIVPVTSVQRVAEPLRMLQYQLAKFRLGSAYVERFSALLLETAQAHLHTLHKELLAPIQHRLKGGNLVVVPHESLHAVPFHALFDGYQYLVDSFAVSYTPSATIYMQCRQKRANLAGPCLVMGVPSPQAPLIDRELHGVAAILANSSLFVGDAASAEVLREQGPCSRIIHIASHGVFRQETPLFSGIRLSDAFLTLYDLHRLRLPADLITLSGCSTGVSAISAGDELIGLTRGLLFSGARSLLVSQWDVSDNSTEAFMKLFYSRFLQQRNRAQALRGAMLELRKSYPHPYYWAPFMLVGAVSA
jgi:CHAT domain-containing protein